MKHHARLALFMTLVSLGALAIGAAPRDDEPMFARLIQGRTLDGWWGLGTVNPRAWLDLSPETLAEQQTASRENIAQHWRVDEDGVLINDGGGLYLTTEKLYEDFDLRLAYRTVAGADSGIYLRGVPQVQIWDWTEAGGKWSLGADKGSGGLWNNTAGAPGRDPLVLADRPFGEWNEFRIVMVGERVTVFLNGQRVVDHARLENYFERDRPVPRVGPIQLQTHGGEIRWRDVRVRDIAAEEANEILRRGGPDKSRTSDGFAPLFNGRDLRGWQGDVDSYVVDDGAIMCREGKGGTLFTDEIYGDFVVRLEIMLPPGGNNGLAIRYPGQGDPAYSGMCELQVLENTDPRYQSLDARQYHGSAYGQVAAERGYQRAPGTWNIQEVTVAGSRIRVELNGTRILDADLAAVDTLMYDAEKFQGRDRPDGHFGFAGHHDPVRYRNVRIKRLESGAMP